MNFLCLVFIPLGSKNFDAVSCLKYMLKIGAALNLTYLYPILYDGIHGKVYWDWDII